MNSCLHKCMLVSDRIQVEKSNQQSSDEQESGKIIQSFIYWRQVCSELQGEEVVFFTWSDLGTHDLCQPELVNGNTTRASISIKLRMLFSSFFLMWLPLKTCFLLVMGSSLITFYLMLTRIFYKSPIGTKKSVKNVWTTNKGYVDDNDDDILFDSRLWI